MATFHKKLKIHTKSLLGVTTLAPNTQPEIQDSTLLLSLLLLCEFFLLDYLFSAFPFANYCTFLV